MIHMECDGCGATCPEPCVKGQIEYATLQASWGYGSKRDGEHFNLHLCPDCFELALLALPHGHLLVEGGP